MRVSIKNTLSQSMDKAVRHYASLFTLPSYRTIILLQALLCIGGGAVSLIVLLGLLQGLSSGLLLGASLFLCSLAVDFLANMLVLQRDSIYDIRRTAAVSLFCSGAWLFFVLLGSFFGTFLSFVWWIRLTLFGFSVALAFRLVIYIASSFIDIKKMLATAYFQSIVFLLPFTIVWLRLGYGFTLNMFLFILFSSVIAYGATHVFLSLLNRVSEKWLEVPPLDLFRAFLVNWITGYRAPFEELLEQLSEEQEINVFIAKFDGTQPKAALVIPSVHPGPFRNIGSSVLPSLLKFALEKKLAYTTCVPLGAQGHELDLASQVQNQKVINHVLEVMSFKTTETVATPLAKVSDGFVTVCCQVFGNFALLSFTLAPWTTEDLPQELGAFVNEEAEKLGLAYCTVVNAHNSINEERPMPEALEEMKKSAVACLEKAVSFKRAPFRMGANTVIPQEFSLADGMGAGGITVFIFEVDNQKNAYVVIDGNNMVSGLREKILSSLSEFGINDGEVFTTDTHSVSAVVLGKRGYHPVGEVINHEKLIGHIKKAVQNALSSMEPVKAGFCNITVPKVKVIGEKRLESLSLLTDVVLKRAKEIVVPISAVCGLLLMFLLLIV
ncbi:MAG: DUF2070 family protein [Candidatus Bathyarchaeia archaeon]